MSTSAPSVTQQRSQITATHTQITATLTQIKEDSQDYLGVVHALRVLTYDQKNLPPDRRTEENLAEKNLTQQFLDLKGHSGNLLTLPGVIVTWYEANSYLGSRLVRRV